MKICYLIDGHSVISQRIAEYFADSGNEILILCSVSGYPNSHKNIELKELGIIKRRMNIPYIEHLDNVMKVKSEVDKFGPDIVHGHYLTSAASHVLALDKEYPVVLSAWGSDVLIDANAKHHRMLFKRASRRAEKITSVAEHLSQRLIELGVTADKIATFPFGVDANIFKSGLDTSALKSEHGIKSGDGVIISTRRLEPIYNHGLVLTAFTRIVKQRPGVKLIMISTGSQETELKAQVKDLDIADNVIFTGFVDDPLLPVYLNLADVYVSASLSDGASISLLEAMACEIFPVVSDIPANREWMEHSKNGYLFPLDDAAGLASLILDALKRPKLRKNATNFNLNLVRSKASWPKTMERFDEIYREILKEE